jgi:CRP-like cAMP-binding protein
MPRFEPKAFLEKAGEGRTVTRFKAGEIIYKQGEPAPTVCYLQSGRIKMAVSSEQGKEAVIGILEPGQFFGEACLEGSPARQTTAVTLASSCVTAINKDAMFRMLVQEPTFSQMFLGYLLGRNSRVEADLMDQLFNSSEKRLARLLLRLAHYGGENARMIPADISQEMLAEMIGSTRTRVNYFMMKFRKSGYITYNGGIKVNASLLSAVE